MVLEIKIKLFFYQDFILLLRSRRRKKSRIMFYSKPSVVDLNVIFSKWDELFFFFRCELFFFYKKNLFKEGGICILIYCNL